MNKWGERLLIYAALALLCIMTATFAGGAAGFWSFVQVTAVIELIYWMAGPTAPGAAEDS